MTSIIVHWPWRSKEVFSVTAALFIFLSWDHLALRVEAKAIKGLLHCLNNEDCLGANRFCFRNITMTEGICTCKLGFKPAEGNIIKCLNILKHECESELDCPRETPCSVSMSYIANMELLIDDFNFSFGDVKKRCIFTVTPALEPHTGGGLRSAGGGDFFESFYNFGAHNHRHHSTPSYHSEYIKFVEDAMLVLFLMCILVTLLVVHRATCRNFWQSRRNGPLRYIIPYRDDQPPPYSQANTATSSADTGNNATANGTDATDGNPVSTAEQTGKGNQRTETPPPTYDEALLITQSSTGAATSTSTTSGVAVNPLFIAMPASPTSTVPEARAIYPVPVPAVSSSDAISPTIIVSAPDVEHDRGQVLELGGTDQQVEDPPTYVSINPLAEVNLQSKRLY